MDSDGELPQKIIFGLANPWNIQAKYFSSSSIDKNGSVKYREKLDFRLPVLWTHQIIKKREVDHS